MIDLMQNKIQILLIVLFIACFALAILFPSNSQTENMETIIELKSKETKTIDDLTLTHVGGGHKILMSEGGGRGGDMSIANITFKTQRLEAEEKRFYNEDEKESFVYDNYIITLVDMTWNGETVTLKIRKTS